MAAWRAWPAVLVLAAGLVAGCGGGSPRRPPTPPTSAAPSPAPSPSPRPTAASPPPFAASVAAVTAADLPHTWHGGCPVGPADLRLMRLSFWGFDGQPHTGTLVVNRAVTGDVAEIFGTLYRERFPIRSMRPEDAWGGSDPESMAADNTSGFNCRAAVSAGQTHWSAHAYGEAIDVNTVENPYLEGGTVMPPAGRAFLDRSRVRPGMAVAGGELVAAFAAAGWQWGGRWADTPDYQHFSKTGG